VACVNDLVARALQLKLEHGRYAYVAPFLAQAKEVAWEYLKRYARPATKNVNESELWVELVNGARIRIHGADNADRLRGAYLDGIVLDEFADMRASVWSSVIRPMLADRQGWATFIGTPKGRNAFFEIYDNAANGFKQDDGTRVKDANWMAMMLRASETKILPESELESNRRTQTPEEYEQEFECSFEAAIVGAYYGGDMALAEREGRIGEHEYDPALPVHVAWDLGIGDSTALWLWQAVPGGNVRVIDCYEDHGKALPHYVGVLNSKPYKYGTDFLPHDAQARELQTGKTRVEALLALGRKPAIVSQQTIEDGINATRMALPSMYFHSRCADGIEALRQYRREFDEKTKAFKNKPKKDWTSHYADSMRYLALAWRELAPVEKKAKAPTELVFEALPDGRLVSNMTVYDRVMQLARKRRVQEHGY
jgi:phage terminase large subunit